MVGQPRAGLMVGLGGPDPGLDEDAKRQWRLIPERVWVTTDFTPTAEWPL